MRLEAGCCPLESRRKLAQVSEVLISLDPEIQPTESFRPVGLLRASRVVAAAGQADLIIRRRYGHVREGGSVNQIAI